MSFRKTNFSAEAGLPNLPESVFAGPLGPARRRMVHDHLWGRDVRDERVLAAMARVGRERFVDPSFADCAYDDAPIEIGEGQTISQPYIVARMSELAHIQPGARVLEIGGGSGYQTAVLMELGAFVHAIELRPRLAEAAGARLKALGYVNFEVQCRDGWGGLPDHAPFDAILLAAAPPEIPLALADQLTSDGRLILPAGPLNDQHLFLVTRRPEGATHIGGAHVRRLFPVRFVPMTGAAQGAES
jgi:protein-L-isoaspartate(D-aspartate) O-methyltransferase